MKFTWLYRIVDYITQKKHVFVIKSLDSDNSNEIKDVISLSNNNPVDVDVYSDCKELFLNLNKHKKYYQVGVINKNDKRNTANIFSNMVGVINPNIKMVTYSDKKSFKKQFTMS